MKAERPRQTQLSTNNEMNSALINIMNSAMACSRGADYRYHYYRGACLARY